MTGGRLIEILQSYDEDAPVYIGNDRRDYGWYTYGGLKEWDIEEKEEDD